MKKYISMRKVALLICGNLPALCTPQTGSSIRDVSSSDMLGFKLLFGMLTFVENP